MRKNISTNLRAGRFIPLATGLLSVLGLVYIITQPSPEVELTEIAVGLGVVLLISGVIYFLLDREKSVSFDERYMYIDDKHGHTSIPLKDVIKTEITATKINNRNKWRIHYYDSTGEELSLSILPKSKTDDFELFKKKVKETKKPLENKDRAGVVDMEH